MHLPKQAAWICMLLCGCLHGSAQEFEVASIKPSPEIDGQAYVGEQGGPGTNSPARYSCTFCEVSELVAQAYGVPGYRLVNTQRLPAGRFHVVATILPGTTREQFQIMLQNLLAERFGLKVHREKRAMRSYRLLVSRGGAKLKPHVDGAPVAARNPGDHAQPGYHFRTHATLAHLAVVIENNLHKPVVDDTDLAGEYDFDLSWRNDDLIADEQSPSDLPTLSEVLRTLGLEIDPHEENVDVIVIDDVAASPTEN